MNWASWNDFVTMGGHGPYVWGSVLVVIGAVAGELVLAGWRRRAALQVLRRQVGGRR